MNQLQKLRDQLTHHNREANRLLTEKGSRNWSASDQAAFDAQMDAADSVQRQISALNSDWDSDASSNFRDAQRGRPTEARRAHAAAHAGFEIFLRKGPGEWSDSDAARVSNAMSTTTPSEGGYTLAPSVASVLVDSLKDYGSIRRVASRMLTSKGNPLAMEYSDGRFETGERVAENQNAAGSDPTFGTAPVNAYKFGSKIITVPIELLQDASIDVGAIVMKRARDRIGRTQNLYMTVGTGTNEPFGLVSMAPVGLIGAPGDTGVAAITFEVLVDLVDSLDVSYLMTEGDSGIPGAEPPGLAGPSWMFNQTVRRHLRKVKDTTGRPIWTPSYDAGITQQTDVLLGYPVRLNNDMPTPAADAISVAFGNFSNYLVRDVMDVQMFRFEDGPYATKGQVGFLAWARAGGNLLDTASVATFKHSAS